jgi:hypothetical protein
MIRAMAVAIQPNVSLFLPLNPCLAQLIDNKVTGVTKVLIDRDIILTGNRYAPAG